MCFWNDFNVYLGIFILWIARIVIMIQYTEVFVFIIRFKHSYQNAHVDIPGDLHDVKTRHFNILVTLPRWETNRLEEVGEVFVCDYRLRTVTWASHIMSTRNSGKPAAVELASDIAHDHFFSVRTHLILRLMLLVTVITYAYPPWCHLLLSGVELSWKYCKMVLFKLPLVCLY